MHLRTLPIALLSALLLASVLVVASALHSIYEPLHKQDELPTSIQSQENALNPDFFSSKLVLDEPSNFFIEGWFYLNFQSKKNNHNTLHCGFKSYLFKFTEFSVVLRALLIQFLQVQSDLPKAI